MTTKNDVVLSALLGHLDVIRRTHDLDDAQTIALLQAALASLLPSTLTPEPAHVSNAFDNESTDPGVLSGEEAHDTYDSLDPRDALDALDTYDALDTRDALDNLEEASASFAAVLDAEDSFKSFEDLDALTGAGDALEQDPSAVVVDTPVTPAAVMPQVAQPGPSLLDDFDLPGLDDLSQPPDLAPPDLAPPDLAPRDLEVPPWSAAVSPPVAPMPDMPDPMSEPTSVPSLASQPESAAFEDVASTPAAGATFPSSSPILSPEVSAPAPLEPLEPLEPAPLVPAPLVPAPQEPAPLEPAPQAFDETPPVHSTNDMNEAAEALSPDDLSFDDLLPAEVTIPDAPALSSMEAANTNASRVVPRFITHTEVDVQLQGRDDLQTLWTKDISKGGLFVTTSDPPPSGTIVTVALQTPDGGLVLKAEVVHVLDVVTAQTQGIDPGVGLQFIDLDAPRRQALEAYVDGISTVLEDGSSSGPSEAATADLLQVARTFLRKVDDSDLYGALRIQTDANDEIVIEAIAKRRAEFTPENLAGLNESDRGRLERAGRVLDRVQKVLLEPFRRLDFDFRQDIVRSKARIDAAHAAGVELSTIRAVWERVWPDRVKAAVDVTNRAVKAITEEGDFATAVTYGAESLKLDPFNTELIQAHRSWEIVTAMPDAFANDAIDPVQWIETARDNHIDLKILRSVWQHVHPQKIEEATVRGRRAIAAEGARSFAQAVEAGEGALALDPFNAEMRSAIEGWRAQILA